MTIQEAYRLYSKIEQEYNTIKEKHDFSVDGRNKAEWRAEKYLKKTPYYDKHLHKLVFPITDTLQIASSIRETSSTFMEECVMKSLCIVFHIQIRKGLELFLATVRNIYMLKKHFLTGLFVSLNRTIKYLFLEN